MAVAYITLQHYHPVLTHSDCHFLVILAFEYFWLCQSALNIQWGPHNPIKWEMCFKGISKHDWMQSSRWPTGQLQEAGETHQEAKRQCVYQRWNDAGCLWKKCRSMSTHTHTRTQAHTQARTHIPLQPTHTDSRKDMLHVHTFPPGCSWALETEISVSLTLMEVEWGWRVIRLSCSNCLSCLVCPTWGSLSLSLSFPLPLPFSEQNMFLFFLLYWK